MKTPCYRRLLMVLGLPGLLMSGTVCAATEQKPVWNGEGLEWGVVFAAMIDGPMHLTVRGGVLLILHKILSFLALSAVVMLVLAGFTLVLSGGSPERKEHAKRIILYVVAGLLIVLFSRLIVGLITLSLV